MTRVLVEAERNINSVAAKIHDITNSFGFELRSPDGTTAGAFFFLTSACSLLPRMRVELYRQADGINRNGPEAEGEILQVAGVFLDAVHKPLVVVVGE